MGILANRPVIREAARAAVEAVAASVREQRQAPRGTPPPPPVIGPDVVDAAAERIAAQPTLVNAMNAEPLRNSRTFMGNLIALVSWVLLVLQFANGDRSGAEQIILNAPEILSMVGAIGGHAISGIGRTVRNLPPINWRRPWTALGIGR